MFVHVDTDPCIACFVANNASIGRPFSPQIFDHFAWYDAISIRRQKTGRETVVSFFDYNKGRVILETKRRYN